MKILIDVASDDVLEDTLKIAGVKFRIEGTDEDILFDGAFSKSDIGELLDWHLDCEFEGVEKKFADRLQSSEKERRVFIDEVFKSLKYNFDANYGINNDLILDEIEKHFDEKVNKLYTHKSIER